MEMQDKIKGNYGQIWLICNLEENLKTDQAMFVCIPMNMCCVGQNPGLLNGTHNTKPDSDTSLTIHLQTAIFQIAI